MPEQRTKSEYGDVSKDDMKIKHIESTTEITAFVTATVPTPVMHGTLVGAAYDVMRGALKLRRENVATDIEDYNGVADTAEVSIGIRGYTCTQWHHEDDLDAVKESVVADMRERLEESELEWENVEFTLEAGEMHDIETTTGSELLSQLDAPSELPLGA